MIIAFVLKTFSLFSVPMGWGIKCLYLTNGSYEAQCHCIWLV